MPIGLRVTENPDTSSSPAGKRSELWGFGTAQIDSDVGAADINVVFRRQPKPVEARHRVAYRTALLAMTLSRFNQGAIKLGNLHTIMWATRSARTRQMFVAWWNGRRSYDTITSRLDPDLQVTLNLALADSLVELVSNRTRVRLTEAGRRLAQLIDEEDGLLMPEKLFFRNFQRLSDSSMERNLRESVK